MGLIGGTPQATVFQFCYCLVLYNLIQVVRGYLAGAEGRGVETVSTEKLFEGVREELIAWNRVVEPATTVGLFTRPCHNVHGLALRVADDSVEPF